jgi:2,3-dihydroxybenzoate decarboxylase
MTELGFKGAMINGQTHGAYLDDDRFSPFWEMAEALNAPIYIHPYNPPDFPYMYHDHPELFGPVWSWTVETANHALRLIFSGLFDRYPRAKLILGHMGETLPYQLWRLDSRWKIANAKGRILELNPSDYLKRNVWITTSGVCSDEPLRCALAALGEERILFSVDHPFENTQVASDWIESADITDAVRRKVCTANAETLLNIQRP